MTAVELFSPYADGPVELIGQGMEGAVYDLGNDLVGKVWFNRQPADVLPLQALSAELTAQDLPFRTPDIRSVDVVDGRTVSIEAKLVGTPLPAAVADGLITRAQSIELFVDVVAALGKTVAGSASKALPVVEEPTSFWQGSPSWGEALADLVRRRAARSRRYLADAVEGFDSLLAQVLARLVEVEVDTLRVVHGDICPPNLLVDERGKTAALLDWGFYTTAGDNTFDASTAAGFYDMYGPDAREIDELLLDRFESELGHSRELMLLYRAAYAMTTATAYSEDGSDGHSVWCVNNINRPDVRKAL